MVGPYDSSKTPSFSKVLRIIRGSSIRRRFEAGLQTRTPIWLEDAKADSAFVKVVIEASSSFVITLLDDNSERFQGRQSPGYI